MIEDTGHLVERLIRLRAKLAEAERNGDDAQLARRLGEHVEQALRRLQRS